MYHSRFIIAYMFALTCGAVPMIVHATDTNAELLVNLEKQCSESGGTWDENAKSCSCHYPNMVLDGTKCRCAEYHIRKDSSDIRQGCIQKTMEETDCRGIDKVWVGIIATCKCMADGHYYDIAEKECKPLTDYRLCSDLKGQATWVDAIKKCVCTDDDKKFFAGKCVDTDEHIALEADQAAQEKAVEQIGEQGGERKQANEARFRNYEDHSPKIKQAHSELERMRLQFDSSVWRDKEGKLNVARIVSDSVAGVALGTTGGVVINNMMKKNQVEDGFEDLKCKIGTEVVAEWGEVFRAGQ